METNFSKGDWVVNQTDRVECNNEIVALIYDGTAAPTACENIDYVTANANLISAAPDMFNTLEELLAQVKQFTAGNIGEQDYFRDEISNAKKALNKAVGSDFF